MNYSRTHSSTRTAFKDADYAYAIERTKRTTSSIIGSAAALAVFCLVATIVLALVFGP